MKNLLNVLFILLFISSCSDTDNSTFPEINDEEENNTEKIIPLKLEIEDTRKPPHAGRGGVILCRFWLISQ